HYRLCDLEHRQISDKRQLLAPERVSFVVQFFENCIAAIAVEIVPLEIPPFSCPARTHHHLRFGALVEIKAWDRRFHIKLLLHQTFTALPRKYFRNDPC